MNFRFAQRFAPFRRKNPALAAAATGVFTCVVLFSPAAVVAQTDPQAGRSAPAGGMSAPPDWSALRLVDVQALVGERNRDVRLARRAVEASRADLVSAGARPNPTLTLGVSAINPQSGLTKAASPRSARLEQLIERGNKRELRIAQAERLESAANADLDDILRQQRLSVTAAYFDLLLAQERLKLAGETADLFARGVEATERRLKAGDVAAADVSRLRVDALRAQNDVRAAQADVARARLALAYLVGAEAQAEKIRAADGWPALEPTPGAAIDELIARRPDLRAARERVDAAGRARDLARSLRTRDVTVSAGVDQYPDSPTNTLGSGTSVGVSITAPLFLRYEYEGEIARAEADLRTAEDLLERTVALARGEAASALADLEAAAARLQRYDQGLLAEARRSVDYAEFAYRNGALGVIDLLDARRTYRAVAIDEAVARADYARASSRWRAAIAEPKEEARRP